MVFKRHCFQEEEWLSGEELCTEGSSDEETPSKTNLKKTPTKKVNKGKQTTQQVKISSTSHCIVESSSEVSESNRTYEYESGEGVINPSIGSAETLDDFEVLWRPKRGSLQLPSCSEGTL